MRYDHRRLTYLIGIATAFMGCGNSKPGNQLLQHTTTKQNQPIHSTIECTIEPDPQEVFEAVVRDYNAAQMYEAEIHEPLDAAIYILVDAEVADEGEKIRQIISDAFLRHEDRNELEFVPLIKTLEYDLKQTQVLYFGGEAQKNIAHDLAEQLPSILSIDSNLVYADGGCLFNGQVKKTIEIYIGEDVLQDHTKG